MARVALVDDGGGCYPLGNGLLIAAAPDMLDALKELLAVAESHILYPCPEIDEARAAIAKAEGTQHA